MTHDPNLTSDAAARLARAKQLKQTAKWIGGFLVAAVLLAAALVAIYLLG